MNPVGMTRLSPLPAAGPVSKTDDPAKIRDTAQQFEALLIGQILRSARESGSGWLGSGRDASSDCITEYAEQHFAAMLAQQGGLGLADLITQGLDRNTENSAPPVAVRKQPT